LGFSTPVPSVASGSEIFEPRSQFSRSAFLDHLMEAANQMSRVDGMPSRGMFSDRNHKLPRSANYVIRRDAAGRPTVWRIGGMTRKLSYLQNGKIKALEETGKLVSLASANGTKIHLLGFETYDFGRTYIGRLMICDEIDSIVMTDLYLRNDGTVVATDDSGCEMTWNPNNGDTSTEFVQTNHQRETWTDHLDGTVTVQTNFDNGTIVKMDGTCQETFRAATILIRGHGGSVELRANGREKVCRTIADPSGRTEVKIISGDINLLGLSLMHASDLRVTWSKNDNNIPVAIIECDQESLLDCIEESFRQTIISSANDFVQTTGGVGV